MPNLTLLPLSHAERKQVMALMDEEVRAWRSELGWDYSPVKQVLISFMDQNLLPGYVACDGEKALGYGYFLIHRNKGVIGTLYVSECESAQEVANRILAKSIEALIDQSKIERIESQLFPFHRLSLSSPFLHQGFANYPRVYLELDLVSYHPDLDSVQDGAISQWDSRFVTQAAWIVQKSYEKELDAVICEDYCTVAGCEGYLRSLLANPGCGVFIPEASFMGWDHGGKPNGFVLTSCISKAGAMIPQISILPTYQGLGLGGALMGKTLRTLKAAGYRKVSLTVTRENTRALEWYQRLGFRVRKDFCAYIWQRA